VVKDNRVGRLFLAVCGWLALALLVVPFASAAERGVVLVYDAQGEQAKSATARTALVIGNGSYPEAPLRNPVNDATDVAEALRGLGFEVVLSLDVEKRVLMQAMRKFRKRLQRRGGVGLFYYAGHGIQVRGRNYLIPVGADIETEADVEYAAVDAGLVLKYMEEAEARLNIVILDACRNNPIERSWRSASRGLVRLELPQGRLGSLLAYSTAPGKVAADGTGRNSPFTKHLLLNLEIANLDLEDVFKRTRIGVSGDTEGRQIPWSESSLLGDFYFQKSTLTGAESPVAMPSQPKHLPQEAQLTVRSNVRGDTVYIDGQEMGSTRLDVELVPGNYNVRVEKEGYEPHKEEINLEPGSSFTVHASLRKRTDLQHDDAQASQTTQTEKIPLVPLTSELAVSNTHIAYVKAIGTGGQRSYALQVADSDGYNPQTILSSRQPIESPSWSPDGSQLAYVSFEDKRPVIYIHQLTTGKRTPIADFEGTNTDPAWSPDGNYLAMSLSHEGNPEIYSLNLETDHLRRLTHNEAVDSEPTWSPDGASLVFSSDRKGSTQLYRISIMGGGATQLTFQGNSNRSPTFAPDGTNIALVHGVGETQRIAILNLKNDKFDTFEHTMGADSLSFSPAGNAIIFDKRSAINGSSLEIVSSDGSRRQQLLPDVAADLSDPAWSPFSK